MIALFLTFLLAAAAGAQTIRHIAIAGNERTRAETIRRELLFRVGEPLDEERLAESERNLRRLPFLADVAITWTRAGEQADVVVRVRDLYARALAPLFSGARGQYHYGLVALDYNLGGRGQSLRLQMLRDAVRGRSAALSFRERRLRGSRHQLAASAGLGDEGHHLGAEFSLPFATLHSRRAYGLRLDERHSVERLYAQGRLSARYRSLRRRADMWYALSRGERTLWRPALQLRLSQEEFAPAGAWGQPPPERRRARALLRSTWWRPRYRQARFVADLGPVEDLQTGSWLSAGAGLSLPLGRGEGASALFEAQVAPRGAFGRTYVFARFLLSGRRAQGVTSHLFYSAHLLVYQRLGAAHALAFSARADGLDRPEDAAQLLLGLDSGLRGYAPHRFDGRRRLLLNGELRPTLYQHSWFVLAGALFADLGAAWTPGEAPRRPPWHRSAGLGLRLGLPRLYGTPVWRLDLARNQRGSWQLSLGQGQYF